MVKRLICVLVAILALPVFSEKIFAGKNSYKEQSMFQLLFLDVPVYIASMTTQKESDAPAVLTIITREEIQNSGARELSDILALVPGFTPGEEIQGFLGYGVRGLWSLEGKMLIMIDGVHVNEILYGNPLFGASFFVDYIERIEIIRGPGSALYGGFGELAVINIITRNSDTPGTSVSTTYGQMAGTFGHRSFNINHVSLVNDVKISINAAAGDGHVSDRDFTDVSGTAFPMKDFGGYNSWFAKLGLNYKDFFLKFMGNSYAVESVDLAPFDDTLNAYRAAADFPVKTRFTSYALDSKYKFRLQDNFSITPRLTYTEFNPWMSDSQDPLIVDYYFYYPESQFKLNVSGEYNFNEKINLTLGGEYSADRAEAKGISPQFVNGPVVNYNTKSVFGEFMAKTQAANITIGARYDKQSHFGAAFVPRFVVTKTAGDFNLKGLISRAYRSPTIMNMEYNSDIDPEYTNTIEAEAEYMLTSNSSLKLNVFDININDIIVYSATDVTYNNFGKTGTRGFDLGYKINEPWGYLNVSYSYYGVTDNGVPTYVARESDGKINKEVLLGFPAHKAALSASYNVKRNISLNPSVLYLGKRYTTYWLNAAGEDLNSVLNPVTLFNLNLRVKQVSENLEIAFGIYNIFDSEYVIAPGYYKAEQGTPSYSREFILKLTCNF